MFERFTAAARELVIGAQDHCRTDGDDRITCRHLLLAAVQPTTPLGEVLQVHGLSPQRLHEPPDMSKPAGLSGPDIDALRDLGIDVEEIERAAESTFGPEALRHPRRRPRRWFDRFVGGRYADYDGPSQKVGDVSGHIPFSSGAKKALELSLREAIRLTMTTIEGEHIVLAALIADDPDLSLTGIDVPALRRALENRLRHAA